MEQLLVYSALFCLEYRMRPADINIELRYIKVMKSYSTTQRLMKLYRLQIRSLRSTRFLRKLKNWRSNRESYCRRHIDAHWYAKTFRKISLGFRRKSISRETWTLFARTFKHYKKKASQVDIAKALGF